ncbi:MAG: DNA-binding protein [Bacillota bacterium]
MDYITPKDAAEKWCISERRIQKLCEEGRIDGVVRFGKIWAIPKDAKKPEDGRLKRTMEKMETKFNHKFSL